MKTNTNTIECAISEITNAANAAKTCERFVDEFIIGKVAGRQGDIYLHMVASNHPHGDEIKNRQLAVGSTLGSRHEITGSQIQIYEGTTLPSWVQDERTPLGPCFTVPERDVNTHPEHADFSLPAGCYQVTHQMDARTWGRVVD